MLVLTRRADALPASYYDELMDEPAPMRGVHVITDKEGRILDVYRDPQEFDGPDGVPEGWFRSPDQAAADGLGMLAAVGFLALLYFAAVAACAVGALVIIASLF
jgi:hypothetical protein